MRQTLLLVALALVAGCSADGLSSEAALLGTGEPVRLERLRAEPYPLTMYGGTATPSRLVVTSAAEWERAWAALNLNLSPAPPRPNVDFSREVVLVAAMGSRPTGGYTVLIEGAVQQDGFVEVTVREVSPGPQCLTTQAVTQPADAARMARVEGPVRFRTVEAVTDCR